MQQTDSPATISPTASPGVTPRGAQMEPTQVAISVVMTMGSDTARP